MTQVIKKATDALIAMERDLNKQREEIDNKIDDLSDDIDNLDSSLASIEDALNSLGEIDQLTLEALLENPLTKKEK